MKVTQPRPSLPVTQPQAPAAPPPPAIDPKLPDDAFGPTAQARLLPTATPSPTGVGTITADRTTWLRDGASGATVSDLQQKLKDAGFDPGPIDGKFGAKTREAVLAFQRAKGISVDGIVGPETRAALLGEPLPPKPTPSGAEPPAGPVAPSGPSGPAASGLEATALKLHGPEFVQKVKEMSARLGVRPEWLLAVMQNESGMNPAAKNPNGGATGLIQFMPATAKALGTTTEALSKMSATEQLAYVEKFYSSFKGRLKSGSDMYLATFWPAAVGKGDDYKIGGADVAKANPAFDLNKDGQITAGEFREYYQKRFPSLSGGPPAPASGGKTDFNVAQAEAAVRKNTARNTQFTMEQIKQNPDAFLKNVVQVDGRNDTSADATSCGPTAMLMGMIAGRPESIQELAAKLVDEQGNMTPAGLKLFGPDANSGLLKECVKRIRDGKFSASDVTFMAEGLYASTGSSTGGTNANDLIALRSAITSLGVSVPRMELQQFGSADGGLGHWRVGVNGKQYNPWPDKKGQASIISGPGGLADGASDGVKWTNREKLYIDDNTVMRNVYSITTKNTPNGAGKTWAVTDDPPLFVARYERQPDGSFKRTELNMARMQQVANGQVTMDDANRVFTDIPARSLS
jgi:hypothetical protein